MKWRRYKLYKFTRYDSDVGGYTICEGYRTVPVYAWGRRTGRSREERYWRIIQGNRTVGDPEGTLLLRDAKAVAEADWKERQ